MRILEFFQETKDGALSSMRLVMLYCVPVIVSVWATISILNRKVEDIPWGVVVVLGALLGSKVWQAYTENMSPPVPPTK
jgi:hypothetical protein